MKKHAGWFIIFLLGFVFYAQAVTAAETYEASYTPWSGYWWPYRTGGLVTGLDYRGTPAPLEKYDMAVHGVDFGPASSYGMEQYYDAQALDWEGMCFCWAAASIMEPEPTRHGVYNDIVFRVGDKKGLLTAAYEDTIYNRYSTDTPEDFHRILEEFIRYQGTPIIIDMGSGEEIWNYPVFKYTIETIVDGSRYDYTTTVYFANDLVDPDYVGTEVRSKTYEYYFILNADDEIVESGWDDPNQDDLPKRAREPYSREMSNPGLDYGIIKAIAETVDDAYEDNDAPENPQTVTTGSYTLLADDGDYFQVMLSAGDGLEVRVDPETENDEIQTVVYDTDLVEMDRFTGMGRIDIVGDEGGWYTIQVEPTDELEDPEYRMVVRQKLPHRALFMMDPEGKMYNGIALCNPEGYMGRVIVTQTDSEGLPVKSFMESIAESQVVDLIDGRFDLDQSRDGYITVDSDVSLAGLQSISDAGNLFSGANLSDFNAAADMLYAPRLYDSGMYHRSEIGVINVGNVTESVEVEFYRTGGAWLSAETFELGSGEKKVFAEIDNAAETARFRVVGGDPCLVGYVNRVEPDMIPTKSAMSPLAGETSSGLVIPHVASIEGFWYTEPAVMNTGDVSADLQLYALDENGLVVDTADMNLQPMENRIFDIAEMFPAVTDIASFVIESSEGTPLCGNVFYGVIEGNQYCMEDGKRLAAMPMAGHGMTELVLPHLGVFDAWETGLAVMNLSSEPVEILFSSYDADGDLLDQKLESFLGNQRKVFSVGDMFQSVLTRDAAYIRVTTETGSPLAGMYLMMNLDNRWMFGDILQDF